MLLRLSEAARARGYMRIVSGTGEVPEWSNGAAC